MKFTQFFSPKKQNNPIKSWGCLTAIVANRELSSDYNTPLAMCVPDLIVANRESNSDYNPPISIAIEVNQKHVDR